MTQHYLAESSSFETVHVEYPDDDVEGGAAARGFELLGR